MYLRLRVDEPLTSTQPGRPFEDRRIEYQRKLGIDEQALVRNRGLAV